MRVTGLGITPDCASSHLPTASTGIRVGSDSAGHSCHPQNTCGRTDIVYITMVTYCDQEFNGPEYSFLNPDDACLVRTTLCEDRDCDTVLREIYDVTRCIHVDEDEEFAPESATCQEVLQAVEQQLQESEDGSRRITDVENAELSHNELHDDTFSILYEHPDLGDAFLLYFSQTRISQTTTAPKML